MHIQLLALAPYWWLTAQHFVQVNADGYDHKRRHHHDDHVNHRDHHHHHHHHHGIHNHGEWDIYSRSFPSVAMDNLPSSSFDSSSLYMNDQFVKSESTTDKIGGYPRESSLQFDFDGTMPPRKKSRSFSDERGEAQREENFVRESRKNFNTAPKDGEIWSFYTNSSKGDLKTSFSSKKLSIDSKFYDSYGTDRRPFPVHRKSKDTDVPIPSASRTRLTSALTQDIGDNNNYIGHSRWTLKYKGMPSEEDLNNTRVNITAKMGGAAFLPCKVGHLGDRQISWIRRRDWHVLTSGRVLYTHDKRFSVLHEPGSQDWTLHIKLVTMRDSGMYECQVSTGTGIISLFVKLSVVIPEAYISGEGQYHVDKGSSISLSCYIRNSPAPPLYILWHHNGQLLNFLRDRHDIKISDDLSGKSSHFRLHHPFTNVIDSGLTEDMKGNEDLTASRLQIPFADEIHSGNYSCSAPNTLPASTLVFITEGDKTAAVQRIHSGSAPTAAERTIVMSIFIWSFLLS